MGGQGQVTTIWPTCTFQDESADQICMTTEK